MGPLRTHTPHTVCWEKARQIARCRLSCFYLPFAGRDIRRSLLCGMKRIQSRTRTEPLELRRAERVCEVQRVSCAVGVPKNAGHWRAGCQVGQVDEADAIILLVVSLLFQEANGHRPAP
jgi:hypothetical protein